MITTSTGSAHGRSAFKIGLGIGPAWQVEVQFAQRLPFDLHPQARMAQHEKKVAARLEGKSVPDLETVICGRNRLESGSMLAWAKAYSLHTGLKEVKMVQNGIRTEGTVALIKDGLKNAKGLRILDLQDNLFTIKGVRALADAVQQRQYQ